MSEMSGLSKRIRNARLMRGLSLQALSDRMENRITRQALHKYEQGVVEPDLDMIQELAEALEIKPDYFFREQSLDIGEIAFRKLSSLTQKEQNRIVETARDFLERYLELEQIIGKQPMIENPLKDFEIKGRSHVEDAAQELRKIWGLGIDPLYNVLELLEDQSIKVVELDGDNSFDGLSTWVNNSIPVIGLNKIIKIDGHLDRYRFNALHELGHLFLDIKSFSEKEQEKLCHYFAGAMLLDKRSIEKEVGLKRQNISLQELKAIKKQYGISMQAIVYRLKDLGVISQITYQNFFRFINSNGFKKDESALAEYNGEEEALRFDQLIGQALIEKYITISKAAALKNQRVTQFRKEFLLG